MADYTEYDLRAGTVDSRRYFAAKFPNSKDDATLPDFEKDFKPPIHLRYEPIPEKELTEEEKEEEEYKKNNPDFRRRGFGRMRFRKKQEHQWMMQNRDKSKSFEGREEGGQTAQYMMLVPPKTQDEPFLVYPIEKWYTFRKPLNFKPLDLAQAEEAMENKVLSNSNQMAKLMGKDKNEEDQVYIDNDRVNALIGSNQNDDDAITNYRSLAMDEVNDTDLKSLKARPRTPEANEEEQIDVRQNFNQVKRHGNEDDADYNLNDGYDDDDDDAAAIVAQEMGDRGIEDGAEELLDDDDQDEEQDEQNDLNANGKEIVDLLSKEKLAALEQREAVGDEEDGDDDFRYDEVKNFSSNYFRGKEKQDDDEADGTAKRSASEMSATKAEASSSSTSASLQPAKKKLKKLSPFEELKAVIIDVLRANRGRMKTKHLVKQLKKKGFLKEAQQRAQFKSAVNEVAIAENDLVNGVVVVLKKVHE